jgi:hypothetical protein
MTVAMLGFAAVVAAPRLNGASQTTGIIVFPGEEGRPDPGLASDDLEVHLVAAGDSSRDLVFPAIRPFDPPPGRYRIWLEGRWRMSPFSLLLGYSGPDPMSLSLPLVPAGRVALPNAFATKQNLAFQLLYVGPYREGGHLRWEISIRKPVAEVGEGLLMPAGRVIAALWDSSRQRYVAISHPFEVRARERVVAPLTVPQGSAHLVGDIQYPRTCGDGTVRAQLSASEQVKSPDVAILTAERLYGFWYDLPPSTVEVRAECPGASLPPQAMPLQAGRIELVRGELRKDPSLEVEIRLPPSLRGESLVLDVQRLPTHEAVAHRLLKPGTQVQSFESLPPTLLEVALETSVGTFSRQVDLQSGADGHLLLDPELMTVSGKVLVGEKARSAKLTFITTRGRKVESHTDEYGHYEAVFVDPVRSVEIAIEGTDQAPYFDFFTPAIGQTRELDFDLPDVTFKVMVVDSETGRPVGGAMVATRNTFKADVNEDSGRSEQSTGGRATRTISQAVTADTNGVAVLPRLRAGKLELRAWAKGYRPITNPKPVSLVDPTVSQEWRLALEPEHDSVVVRLLLPGGRPASGAEGMLLGLDSSAFQAIQADPTGELKLPAGWSGLLAIRHRDAGSLVIPWRPPEHGEPIAELSLPARSPHPLVVRVQDRSRRVSNAELAVWIGGWRLSGPALAFVTGSEPVADALSSPSVVPPTHWAPSTTSTV